ncbi:hypothetical protein D3C81_2213130 [compost metagenome]|jgi:putative bacteriocin precursor|uniref:Apre_1838 family putative sactipeptide bacteriocin n=1 Tax=Paenibacillus sonchi TaxID=373687 RepID=A0A974PE30_9BACL|nr:Apre_1838 family putative sactipeptide bacteriocin [Paenibacillus sonchi]MCE3202821.1 Apre_1838 family putative sactipeptide bacteriocin [Paenibacillus sonchi]QQZ61597.1 Apre_1838 family putative sactipeptide bacteriocin [Paenibacillus sonchi]
MKLINPIGRDINSGLEAHFEPMACMCGSGGGQFTGARGNSDSCFHCGCDCTSSSYGSGNDRNATTTIHRS